MAVDGDFGVFLGSRLHEIGLPALYERAGQLLARAVQHADHGRFAAAAAVFALGQLDQHAVAVPCAARCVRRDEQVIRLGLALTGIGRDKAERALGGKVGAGHAAVVRGDGKAVFLVFHHAAVCHQAVERVFQLVFARLGQRAADFVYPHGLREQRKQFAFYHILLLHGKAPSLLFQYTTIRVGLKGKKA